MIQAEIEKDRKAKRQRDKEARHEKRLKLKKRQPEMEEGRCSRGDVVEREKTILYKEIKPSNTTRTQDEQ